MWIYDEDGRQNRKATTAITAARICSGDAINSLGDLTVKAPTSDSAPYAGVSDTDAIIGDTVPLVCNEGDIVELEVAAAVLADDELMIDLTALSTGRVKPATSGKQVVALCTIAQPTIGKRCSARLTRYFKP